MLFLVTAMEPTPTVGVPPTAQPADAARTKAILKRIREAVKSEDDTQLVAVSEAEINSAFAVAARGLPIRGKAQISPESASINISTGLPRIPLDGWRNVGITVLPAEDHLHLASVRVGPYRLPPGLVMPTLGLALDMPLGDGLGSVTLNSIDRAAMRPDQISLGFTISADDKEAMLAATKDRVRQGFPFGNKDDVRGYYLAIDEAASQGDLPRSGSFAPYLRFAYRSVLDRAVNGDQATALRSAFLALAVYCGERKLQSLVGDVIPEALKSSKSYCRSVTLSGRSDLRQHFIVSAALKLAGDSGLAFAVGEFKEMLDANRGGSGFSFDDIAANRAGIRFAEDVLGLDTLHSGVHKRLRELDREYTIFRKLRDYQPA